MENVHKERHVRSLSKAMSWRILATLTTICIAYCITGKVDLAVMIGGFEFLAKLVIYYGHERLWQSIRWGYETKA